MQLTITEALAEIKLIDKRVEKKKAFIRSYIVRQNLLVDPLGDSGGSRKVLACERQAIRDLWKRKVDLRAAINRQNLITPLTIGKTTKTVAEWLIWRKEVSGQHQRLLVELKSDIDVKRREAQSKQVALVPAEKQPEAPTDVVVNLSERELGSETEEMETILGTLDGQLSLLNAITTITLED